MGSSGGNCHSFLWPCWRPLSRYLVPPSPQNSLALATFHLVLLHSTLLHLSTGLFYRNRLLGQPKQWISSCVARQFGLYRPYSSGLKTKDNTSTAPSLQPIDNNRIVDWITFDGTRRIRVSLRVSPCAFRCPACCVHLRQFDLALLSVRMCLESGQCIWCIHV